MSDPQLLISSEAPAVSREVMAISDGSDNARLIEDAARLGYLTGHVLDLTYGEGKFWKRYTPEEFTTNDLDPTKVADFHYDARRTPWGSGDFETVVFDPPYKLAGTRSVKTADNVSMDSRYGTGGAYVPTSDVHTLLLEGVTEAARLSSRWVLVKCMDQVNGGRIRWQTDIVTVHAANLGLDKVDAMMLRRWRPQPGGRSQQHARRNYSTLLVFEKSPAPLALSLNRDAS